MFKSLGVPLFSISVITAIVCLGSFSLFARAEDESTSQPVSDADSVTRPCGTYDIQKLDEHFRVTVAIQKMGTGHKEVTITADENPDDKDLRKVFPTGRIRLAILDEKGGT